MGLTKGAYIRFGIFCSDSGHRWTTPAHMRPCAYPNKGKKLFNGIGAMTHICFRYKNQVSFSVVTILEDFENASPRLNPQYLLDRYQFRHTL